MGSPLIPRDPGAETRTRRALDKIASLLNSLIQSGEVIQIGDGDWALSPKKLAANPPVLFDFDAPAGDPGPPGPQGPQGEQGEQGPAGADGGGGGSSGGQQLYHADVTPASPHANDDEFDTGSLDTGVWTEWDVGGFQTVTVGDYGLKLVQAGSPATDANAGVYRDVPSGDWSIITKLSLSGLGTNFSVGGMFLAQDLDANPSTADFRMFGILYQDTNSLHVRLIAYSAYNASSASIRDSTILGHGYLYLRIRRITSTLYYDYSTDGLDWIQFYSEAEPFTLVHVGLLANNPLHNGQPDAVAYFRFWRQTSITTLDQPLLGGLTSIQGVDGDQGPIGPEGPPGEEGPMGIPGPQGAIGPAGETAASIFEARLTSTTGDPVPATGVSAATTIYLTPYRGNKVGLYDGAAWGEHTLTEISLALSGLTANSLYDVFLWNDSGTLKLELSAAWATTLVRTDAITTVDGIAVKSGSTTRRLVGTIRATGTGQTTDTTSQRFIANLYNKVNRLMFQSISYTDDNAPTTGSVTATSFAELNSGTNAKAEFVLCEFATVRGQGQFNLTAPAANTMHVGVGRDSTTSANVAASFAAAATACPTLDATFQFAAGYHWFSMLGKVSGGTGTIAYDLARFGSSADPYATFFSGEVWS